MKLLFLILGLLCLGLGTVGVVVPILPSTPFYLAAAFCFAKGSAHLHTWFLSTRLYKSHLESFVKKRAMRFKTKVSIMLTVTAALTLVFLLMSGLWAGQLVLCLIWLLHMLYFIFRVKTLNSSTPE